MSERHEGTLETAQLSIALSSEAAEHTEVNDEIIEASEREEEILFSIDDEEDNVVLEEEVLNPTSPVEDGSSDDTSPTIEKQLETKPVLDEDSNNGFWARQFKRMARKPWLHLVFTLVVCIGMSAIAMTVGGFEVAVDNKGWQSRGTVIADRQAQLMLTKNYQEYLFSGGPAAWSDLQKNVQPGWEVGALGDSDEEGRRLAMVSGDNRRELPFHLDARLLQEIEGLDGCDVSWYTNWTILEAGNHLWPVWRAKRNGDNFMDPVLLKELCVAESNTQAILEANGLCFGCTEGCLPPYSIVLYARLVVPNGFSLECKELSEAWAQYRDETASDWVACVEDLKTAYNPKGPYEMPETCPAGFSPTMLQENFDKTAKIMYTSSIFATREEDIDGMYDLVESFDRGSSKIQGAYDTPGEDFGLLFSDAAVGSDMALACGSAFITTAAMMVHTRSPFVTVIGLLQIIVSFPMSYFVYTFIGGLEFFPFLNFIGIFVLFALGADNVFVATDKWKNARLEYPEASITAIAGMALPDASGAIFLTAFTTAIAFFGTAICPVAPIKLFAIFCGFLVSFDYILCVLLVFPALCIYDRRLQSGTSNWFFSCGCCKKNKGTSDEETNEGAEEKPSLIRRMLLNYYSLLHRFRWGLLLVSLTGLGVCTYIATSLKLPATADARVLDPDQQFEQNYAWRKLLLYDVLRKSGGSEVSVGFGLTPADTGDLNSPERWTQLVLDNSFDPSSEEAQAFLGSFCADLFQEDFADFPSEGYECPFDLFSTWVKEQSISATPDEAYVMNCGGAQSIPMPQQNFHDCIIAWSQHVEDTRVLANNGKVKIIWFEFGSRVRWDSPFDELDEEWNRITSWFDGRKALAPSGVNNFFFSSEDFWWYDTNGKMLSTTYGSAAVALGGAAAIILFASQSFSLTFMAVITIGYVLTAVTATLIGLGWTLGFLESICFAILIGVSVDFVIHFAHSYGHYKGNHSRSERTQHALIQMGPSILAAAFTTIAAATIMLFTIITFFQKFALILFMTIVHATIGSFLVFLVMVDCVGPNEPTALMDRIVGFCKAKVNPPQP